MSNPGEPFRISSECGGTGGSSLRQEGLAADADLRVPLQNLSAVKVRMDSLQDFLSQSVNTNTLIPKHQMDLVSSEITAAIHQIIVNGAALLSCAQKAHFPDPDPDPVPVLNPNPQAKPKFDDLDEEDSEVIELDAVELLSEHIHLCEICGKGFKRDANLRMHMRAHGDQYKTREALAKKSEVNNPGRNTRFSCPYDGCNRNKKHPKFRPLKSVICVRNHFKRSHCPKMYSCNRCHKKSFSVLADLKAHLKHCAVGEEVKKWKCSCGNGFSRKDKLFGHISLFEGHMPAIAEEPASFTAEVDRKLKGVAAMEEDEVDSIEKEDCLEDGFFDDLLDRFGSFEKYSLQDVLGPSHDALQH